MVVLNYALYWISQYPFPQGFSAVIFYIRHNLQHILNKYFNQSILGHIYYENFLMFIAGIKGPTHILQTS